MDTVSHWTNKREKQDGSGRDLLQTADLGLELSDLQKKLSKSVVKSFEMLFDRPLKPLVYTSFDGDNMHYLEWMCYITHKLGLVPVNPEAALGYYLSTTAHNGIKIEVMRDCVALELACQELWIFDTSASFCTSNLPEGVVAELILWNQIRSDSPIRYFPYLQTSKYEALREYLEKNQPQNILKEAELPLDMQKSYFAKMDPLAISEIERKLLHSVKGEEVRPLAYISQDFYDFKHVDWARALAYKLGYVPFSPETLIKHFVVNEAYRNNLHEEYLLDRISLLSAAQELWVFVKPSVSLLSNATLPETINLDLYYWLKYRTSDPIRFFSWRDADVPKYAPNNYWALTTYEHMENIQTYVR